MKNSWCLPFAALVGFLIVASSANNDTECSEFDETDGGPQIIPCKDELTLQQGTNYTLKCRADTPVVFIQQELGEENYGNFKTVQRSNFDNDTELYEADIELIGIDRFAIGYYACIRTANASVDINTTIESLAAEPNNTASTTYIYIYVNGTDSLYAPMREMVMGVKDDYIVECKPSTPDVEVKISLASQNKTLNNIKFTPKIGFILDTCSNLAYKCWAYKNGKGPFEKKIRSQKEQPSPTVSGLYNEFLEGETFSINCSVKYAPNLAQVLSWNLPPDINNTAIHSSNQHSVTEGLLYYNITIVKATREHARKYDCVAKTHCGPKEGSFNKTFLEQAVLGLKTYKMNVITGVARIESKQQGVNRTVNVNSYPPAQFKLLKNNLPVENGERNAFIRTKNNVSNKLKVDVVVSVLQTKGVEDSGNYTLVASNGKMTKNITFDIRFMNAPKVLPGETIKYCGLNRQVSLQCEVTGYPPPSVTWLTGDQQTESTIIEQVSMYKVKAILVKECNQNMNITCKATNGLSPRNSDYKRIIELRVNEIPEGFGIQTTGDEGEEMWFAEKDNVSVKCLASIHDFSYVDWELNSEKSGTVNHTKSQFSQVAILNINQISTSDAGTYVCVGKKNDDTLERTYININVDELTLPTVNFSTDINGLVEKFQLVHLNCNATGMPRPTISWYKDNKEFVPGNDTNIVIEKSIVDRKTVNSTIYIKRMNEKNRGTYECVAGNGNIEVKKSQELNLKEVAYMKYVIAIVVIIALLIAVVVFLIIKLKKDKIKRQKLRAELAAAGLLYFKEGQSKSLNPDLFIDEQADLLPYDERFEFPPEKLTLGKQLGAGAFGVVYKAEARGIINAEETTPVAVKQVKRTADNMFIKALATELKIMVHLGKHVNIVNLLGACTKNVGKRELSVIVEYCKFGNIHNYMQRHRDVFIDLFSADTSKEKNFGKVNRGYDSSGSTGLQSDYGTANTQDTNATFLTNNSNRTSRKTSESYVQPEWRSNYVSDYSYDERSPRPLTSRDLLCWAFQIARGMEYLAKRKILHGDLAARNILLAEDNVVKICDFGLARSIYKNDEYKKREHCLVPIKWLALECMTDRLFSTQSDVWSYGVVLWELFTLAKTPYPNMDPAHLMTFLQEGRRLDKPPYADDRIYEVMKRCWAEKPTMRPSFTQLQEELGTFLEENVRNHYMDLNNPYLEFNEQGGQDYLAMVSAPDYNNMVTPSPHHYVNQIDPRRFFPPSPAKVGEDGYLQMTPKSGDIFSPKPNSGTRFDFDARKLNSRPSEATSVGSELTPMLTINNLPRSNSDSDHEGTVYPFPNGCPTINEESVDDVFFTRQNNETAAQNARNAQNTAVTNPTYITFDIDDEKKPKDLISYVNIQPNGLVK